MKNTPHFILEILAYLISTKYFLIERQRKLKQFDSNQNLFLFGMLIFFAAIGSKLLYLLQYYDWISSKHNFLLLALSGKTVVGGFLGGLIGVELAKKNLNIKESTGDAFIFPIITGLIIGRIGCLMSGLEDLTFGSITSYSWGFDYGDGSLRHPVVLYEIIFLITFAISSYFIHTKVNGDRFKLFISAYMFFRIIIDFLKPPHGEIGILPIELPQANLHLGLSAIQWACIACLFYYIKDLKRILLSR
jgi:prolipoprotein diacylglyceryltransferase